MPALALTPSMQLDDRSAPLFDDDFLDTLEYLHIIARKILSGQMKAERRSRQKGVSVEFADHRPYSPGDDFRFIDWNVFFRTDHLFLKLFEEEEDLYIYLLLDCSGSIDFGKPYKFHYLRRLTAAIGDLRLHDAETGRFREVTLTEGLLRRYRQTFTDWCTSLEQFCRKSEVGYVRCRTDVPFTDTIIHMLRRERFLQ